MDILSVASTQTRPRAAMSKLKLLVPIDATERSRWGIQYAKQCWASGRDVEVVLLAVAEPITSWQVLRFLSQERVRLLQAERARYLLEDAAQALRKDGVAVQMHYKEGDIAFEILDAAEQLECDEIVLPAPYPTWKRLFAPDIVPEVLAGQRSVPVVTVNAAGAPERVWTH